MKRKARQREAKAGRETPVSVRPSSSAAPMIKPAAAPGFWPGGAVLGAVCLLVVAVFFWRTASGPLEAQASGPESTYYNLLVQGFRAGQLNLKMEAPEGFLRLKNPYDPIANLDYRFDNSLWDLSYYHGKLFLYFGITPALVLFWPYAALTGQYLWHKDAVVVFCMLGFLASVGLLRGVWRRYFPEVSSWTMAAGALASGLATFIPTLLPKCDVYEVPISCDYAFTMLALLCIWRAGTGPVAVSGRWLAAASVSYGLVVGSRPTELFGAAALLIPVAQAWPDRREAGKLLLAATGPMLFIGIGLAIYNVRRFDNPGEFGLNYQLTPFAGERGSHFDWHYLWINYRAYFFETSRWSWHFPFVHDWTPAGPKPKGYSGVDHHFGILTNIPFVWLALAAPLAWRNRAPEEGRNVRWFLAVVTVVLGTCVLTLGFFSFVANRYEVEFIPSLMLLAVIGVFALERHLAGRPGWRLAARWGWGLLLVFSVGFNLLASYDIQAETERDSGDLFLRHHQLATAIGHYETALQFNPELADVRNNLGLAFSEQGRLDEAIPQYQTAIRLQPDYALAHDNLGKALYEEGQYDAAITECQEALRLQPEDGDACCNLGSALFKEGRLAEAIVEFQQSIHWEPGRADTHNNLGFILQTAGRLADAIAQYREAIRLKPDYATAHNNLGFSLQLAGQLDAAVAEYQEALRLRPDYPLASKNLANVLALKNVPANR